MRLAVGDYLEIEVQDDSLVIRPVKVVHPDQEYFFTKEWQKMESEADQDIAEGRLEGPFQDTDEALKALKTLKA